MNGTRSVDPAALAWLLAQLGPATNTDDLTARNVAFEVLAECVAAVLAEPLRLVVDGVVTMDRTGSFSGLERQITDLQDATGPDDTPLAPTPPTRSKRSPSGPPGGSDERPRSPAPPGYPDRSRHSRRPTYRSLAAAHRRANRSPRRHRRPPPTRPRPRHRPLRRHHSDLPTGGGRRRPRPHRPADSRRVRAGSFHRRHHPSAAASPGPAATGTPCAPSPPTPARTCCGTPSRPSVAPEPSTGPPAPQPASTSPPPSARAPHSKPPRLSLPNSRPLTPLTGSSTAVGPACPVRAWAEAATLARTAVAYNVGTLAVAYNVGTPTVARERGVQLIDGFDCAWTSHPDPTKPPGRYAPSTTPPNGPSPTPAAPARSACAPTRHIPTERRPLTTESNAVVRPRVRCRGRARGWPLWSRTAGSCRRGGSGSGR
ncbi:hypothetical protein SAMN05216371_7479 [Streptomyces sp. TLI_053]|nr:hypothetical protein SAMN05216371_7479 [Streptomyces sp. TLI_053]